MKKKTIYILSALAFLTVGVFFYQNFSARSASYSFFQTDWSGGASLTATATHPGDSSGWDKYYSADPSIATNTPGQVSLKSTSVNWTQTETADFDQGDFAVTYASSGKIALLKPDGVVCSDDLECFNECSTSGYCNNCGSDFNYSGQIYGTVEIGNQCWMAENLNVGTMVDSVDTGSFHSDVSDNGVIEKYCYNNDETYCEADGGYYEWSEMMGYVNTEGSQGICPPSWHVPTDAEWYELEGYLSTESCSSSRIDWGCDPTGTILKEGGSSGFEAKILGLRYGLGNFGSYGSIAYYWSSSESGSDAWRRGFTPAESRIFRSAYGKTSGFPVRCIKD